MTKADDNNSNEFVLYDEHEFRADMTALGLNSRSAARFLHRDRRIVCRWLAGTQDIPPTAGMLLRLMIATGYTPERTTALLDH